MLDKVYYQLYADDSEIPSKVAIDPEEPSIGRIRGDSIAPPHTPASIKRHISRVERNPALVNSTLFADSDTSDSPLKEGYISILRTDGPGLSPNEPMAIVQAKVQVESPLPVKVTSIPNGRYLIKNQAAPEIYWGADRNPIQTVYLYPTTTETAKKYPSYQVSKHSPIILLFKG